VSGESLRIHPAALEEAEAALDWYARRSRRAAGMFLDELDRAMDQIGQNPEQHPRHDFGTRRFVLRRFPFVIVFRKGVAGVEIIAIAHGRRRPGYWRERLG
jgi:plasmid stabilization system protein ParE